MSALALAVFCTKCLFWLSLSSSFPLKEIVEDGIGGACLGRHGRLVNLVECPSHVVGDLDDGRLVAAHVHVVGRRPDGRQLVVKVYLVALLAQLMRSQDVHKAIRLQKSLDDVRSKRISGTPT